MLRLTRETASRHIRVRDVGRELAEKTGDDVLKQAQVSRTMQPKFLLDTSALDLSDLSRRWNLCERMHESSTPKLKASLSSSFQGSANGSELALPLENLEYAQEFKGNQTGIQLLRKLVSSEPKPYIASSAKAQTFDVLRNSSPSADSASKYSPKQRLMVDGLKSFPRPTIKRPVGTESETKAPQTICLESFEPKHPCL